LRKKKTTEIGGRGGGKRKKKGKGRFWIGNNSKRGRKRNAPFTTADHARK